MTTRIADPACLSDDELIERVTRGNVTAFELLYTRFEVRACTIARSICRDRGHAEDAVQDAFLSVWRGRRKYQEEHSRSGVAAWLLTIVRHRAIDMARREGRAAARTVSSDVLADQAGTAAVAESVTRDQAARSLRDHLALLPQAQREVIALAFYGEMTHEEIAAHLSLASGTVKGRMRLGLEKLRMSVEDDLSP